MNEINFKKFYPVNLEKKKDEINDFWNQIFKEVRDEKIFELIEKVLRNKSLKVDEVIILLYNIKKVDEYLIRKNTELSDFIISIKFDLSEKKEKRKECLMDIYQAIVSYYNKNEVETALNFLVEDNIDLKKEESEIAQVYQEYSSSKKDYILFLYDETIKAIKNNKLKETLEKFYVSEEREVFSYIMEKVLLDIVYYVKLEKPYIEQILADFFDRVKHEVRIESFKRILNYYVEEYEEDEDISICSRVIMEKIHEYLKDPHKNSPKWQWGDFSEAQIEIMRIWLVSADLEKYFSIEVNDKVRLQFWRRYIKYIKEVRYFERLKQAIVSYFNENDVELALNLFVDENINFEKEDESEIIQVYQEYSKSKKDYTLFLYDETVKAIKNNKLKDTLDRLFISEEREVFLDIMNKVLFDIVYFVKLEKDYINKILADFFDRVTHEVRIESFKKVLNYYVEEYEKTDDISVCSRAIMEKIHEYLKDPHKNSPKWQWGDFSEAQIEIMRIWLVSADLEKYFSIEVKDKIRLKFWKRYIKYIKEVRYFERLKQAIVMLTDEHIFIEFGEKGNAAYCHRKDYISFNEINRLSTNSKLKDRDEAVFFIPHSGNWDIKLKTRLYELGYRVKIWR